MEGRGLTVKVVEIYWLFELAKYFAIHNRGKFRGCSKVGVNYNRTSEATSGDRKYFICTLAEPDPTIITTLRSLRAEGDMTGGVVGGV